MPIPPPRPIVAGVPISHPGRVLFRAARVSKIDLARYYETIAGWILPHVAGRPLTLVRCPTGASGECFYMKHSKLWAPPALRRVRIREKTKVGDYLIADSGAALVSLVQMDVLEIHTWNARFERVEQPDRIVLDLDPGEQVGWPTVVAAARVLRELLAVLELESFVKTTGGRGLHVVVPLAPRAEWPECLAFARAVGETLVRQDPATFTTAFAKRGRSDKILIDYLRNNRTNTSIAAFSPRARPEAPVSVPVTWNGLSARRPPDRFTIHTVAARLARLRDDPWSRYWSLRQTIPRNAHAALERL